MLHQRVHQKGYRLKAELNTGKFEVHQYPISVAGSLWKFHVPEGQRHDGLQISEI
jgi:hypothetical protein